MDNPHPACLSLKQVSDLDDSRRNKIFKNALDTQDTIVNLLLPMIRSILISSNNLSNSEHTKSLSLLVNYIKDLISLSAPGDSRIKLALVNIIWSTWVDFSIKADPSAPISKVSKKLDSTNLENKKLVVSLLNSLLKNEIIDPDLAKELLDPELLHDAKLIHSQQLFKKKLVVTNTNILYIQNKFNLLRESNIGYSKLVTVIISSMLSFSKKSFDEFYISKNIPNQSPSNATSPTPISSIIMEYPDLSEATVFLTSQIQKTIGFHSIDPNRVADIILDLFVANLKSYWPFFISIFLRSDLWIPESPSITLSQLIGHKLTFFQKNVAPQETYLPEEIINVSCLLFSNNLIDISVLYNFLSPSDDEFKSEIKKINSELLDASDDFSSSLASMGALDDLGSGDDDLIDEEMESEDKEEEKKDTILNQKKILICSLLGIGELATGLAFVQKFPGITSAFPEVSDYINRILHQLVDPVISNMPQFQTEFGTTLEPVRSGFLKKITPEKILLINPFPSINLGGRKIMIYFYQDYWTYNNFPSSFDSQILPDLMIPWLSAIGPRLSRDVSLLTNIIRLCKFKLSELCESQLLDADSKWMNLLRLFIIPAVSSSKCNPALINEFWLLLSILDIRTRFSIYHEWKEYRYTDNVEMKAVKKSSLSEIRSILRRLSKETVKIMGRKLCKACHMNPLVVLPLIVERISYDDNLIGPIVEAFRFLTPLGIDILMFVTIEVLFDKNKPRVKANSVDLSNWLSSLCDFTSTLVRRFSSSNPDLLLTCLVQKLILILNSGDSEQDILFELEILNQFLVKLAAIEPLSNPSIQQLQALQGGSFLIKEAYQMAGSSITQLQESMRIYMTSQMNLKSHTNFNNKGNDSTGPPSLSASTHFSRGNSRACQRLVKSLIDNKLVYPLIIGLSKQTQLILYGKNNSARSLKATMTLYDIFHVRQLQFLHFCQSYVFPQISGNGNLDSLNSKSTFIPDLQNLHGKNGLTWAHSWSWIRASFKSSFFQTILEWDLNGKNYNVRSVPEIKDLKRLLSVKFGASDSSPNFNSIKTSSNSGSISEQQEKKPSSSNLVDATENLISDRETSIIKHKNDEKSSVIQDSTTTSPKNNSASNDIHMSSAQSVDNKGMDVVKSETSIHKLEAKVTNTDSTGDLPLNPNSSAIDTNSNSGALDSTLDVLEVKSKNKDIDETNIDSKMDIDSDDANIKELSSCKTEQGSLSPNSNSTNNSLSKETSAHSSLESAIAAQNSTTTIDSDLGTKSSPLDQQLLALKNITNISFSVSGLPEDLVDYCSKNLPNSVFNDGFLSEFYVVFWILSLYDIEVPVSRYQFEVDRLGSFVKHVSTFISSQNSYQQENSGNNVRLNNLTLEKESEKAQLLVKSLEKEMSEQSEHVKRVNNWLIIQKGLWFSLSSSERFKVSECLFQYCIFPRAINSASDSIFAAKFITLMQFPLKTSMFPTLVLLDKIFNSSLLSILESLTEDESINYSLFLNTLLSKLNIWHTDCDAYVRECIGPGSCHGFIQKWNSEAGTNFFSNNDKYNITHMLSHSNFIKINFKWHTILQRVFTSAINSSDADLVRKALLGLRTVSDFFPATLESGTSISNLVKKLVTNSNNLKKLDYSFSQTQVSDSLDKSDKSQNTKLDESVSSRQDIKVLARACVAILESKKSKWVTSSLFFEHKKTSAECALLDNDPSSNTSSTKEADTPKTNKTLATKQPASRKEPLPKSTLVNDKNNDSPRNKPVNTPSKSSLGPNISRKRSRSTNRSRSRAAERKDKEAESKEAKNDQNNKNEDKSQAKKPISTEELCEKKTKPNSKVSDDVDKHVPISSSIKPQITSTPTQKNNRLDSSKSKVYVKPELTTTRDSTKPSIPISSHSENSSNSIKLVKTMPYSRHKSQDDNSSSIVKHSSKSDTIPVTLPKSDTANKIGIKGSSSSTAQPEKLNRVIEKNGMIKISSGGKPVPEKDNTEPKLKTIVSRSASNSDIKSNSSSAANNTQPHTSSKIGNEKTLSKSQNYGKNLKNADDDSESVRSSKSDSKYPNTPSKDSDTPKKSTPGKTLTGEEVKNKESSLRALLLKQRDSLQLSGASSPGNNSEKNKRPGTFEDHGKNQSKKQKKFDSVANENVDGNRHESNSSTRSESGFNIPTGKNYNSRNSNSNFSGGNINNRVYPNSDINRNKKNYNNYNSNRHDSSGFDRQTNRSEESDINSIPHYNDKGNSNWQSDNYDRRSSLNYDSKNISKNNNRVDNSIKNTSREDKLKPHENSKGGLHIKGANSEVSSYSENRQSDSNISVKQNSNHHNNSRDRQDDNNTSNPHGRYENSFSSSSHDRKSDDFRNNIKGNSNNNNNNFSYNTSSANRQRKGDKDDNFNGKQGGNRNNNANNNNNNRQSGFGQRGNYGNSNRFGNDKGYNNRGDKAHNENNHGQFDRGNNNYGDRYNNNSNDFDRKKKRNNY
ncbi:THO complex subunit 2 [Smittium culicis]|uniref:THO complex subunit 2 n=1 Tax=Smittium culicis TaxID=133412 RepID=A0A1R1YLI8_9FUNG|nr:THO complex subunit 2 [Smittium culicis]